MFCAMTCMKEYKRPVKILAYIHIYIDLIKIYINKYSKSEIRTNVRNIVYNLGKVMGF